MIDEENLIFSTLEQSLRQFQKAEQRLQERLRKVEAEAMDLKIEIEALQNSAEKTEEALESLFSTMRSGTKSWKTHRKAAHEEELEPPRKPRYEDENSYQRSSTRYDDEGDYQRNTRYDEEDDYDLPPRRYTRQNANNPSPPENYRNNSVSYLKDNPKNVAPINRSLELKSNRFADRTITQACTLLLREAPKALHVNELFQFAC